MENVSTLPANAVLRANMFLNTRVQYQRSASQLGHRFLRMNTLNTLCCGGEREPRLLQTNVTHCFGREGIQLCNPSTMRTAMSRKPTTILLPPEPQTHPAFYQPSSPLFRFASPTVLPFRDAFILPSFLGCAPFITCR